jgi:predicted alpha/beta superfamily hydrolase
MGRIMFATIVPIAIGIMLPTAIMAQDTVLLQINQLPSYHPANSDIYIAGSFNGWNPNDDKYKFYNDGFGHYYFNLTLPKGTYEYKITRGGWDKGECKNGGNPAPNRVLKMPEDKLNRINIEDWADRYPPKPKVSTASKNVHILDPAFLIPQLGRTRRIWIYLPEDYARETAKRYPVLYMQDGQNLFDDTTSYAGEWGIDEYMDHLTEGQCIVVGIDHGGDKRMTEYNPYDNKKFGKGEGKKYVDFLVKTLKPYIDKNFRTLPEMQNTGIAGSSMGGLISLYAVLQYPGIFGKAGIFSPSLWITDNKIFTDIKKKAGKTDSYIYLYGGKAESGEMVVDLVKAADSFQGRTKGKIVTAIREGGLHNEARWRLEFPFFYRAVLIDGTLPTQTLGNWWMQNH